ncbi:MAG: hypothetical protein ACQESL_04830, partial [Bacteroidota bacterium]
KGLKKRYEDARAREREGERMRLKGLKKRYEDARKRNERWELGAEVWNPLSSNPERIKYG